MGKQIKISTVTLLLLTLIAPTAVQAQYSMLASQPHAAQVGPVETMDSVDSKGSGDLHRFWVGEGQQAKDLLEELAEVFPQLPQQSQWMWATDIVYCGSENVAQSVSMMLDAQDHPHIAFCDGSGANNWCDNLRYAYFDGITWTVELVDSGNTRGRNATLALDSQGNPHIAYLEAAPSRVLRYTYKDAGIWYTEAITDCPPGDSTRSLSLVLDSGDNSHLACSRYNGPMYYLQNNGTGWAATVVESGITSWAASIALDSLERPHISYYEWASARPRWAYHDGATWQVEVLSTAPAGLGWGGTSLKVGPGDLPLAAFDLSSGEGLWFGWYDSSVWTFEAVDDSNNRGNSPSLDLDTSGNPHVSYRGPTQLQYAYHNGITWTIAPVDSASSTGNPSSLMLDSAGRPHIAYREAGQCLGYAYPCWPPEGESFSWEPAEPVYGEMITFTGWATGTGDLAFAWDFGDGITATGRVVTHTYATGGSYEVAMQVSNPCSQTVITQSVLVCSPPISSSFDWTPEEPEVGEGVIFSGYTQGTGPLSYVWDFGDGGSGLGQVITHTYGGSGVFTITMTVTNSCGQQSAAASLYVCAPLNGSALSWQPGSPLPGEMVTFTAFPAGSAPYTLTWDLGDGVTATGRVVTHTYAATGSYGISLLVENPCSSEVVTDTLTISWLPQAGFHSSTPTCLGQATLFTNTSEGGEPLSFWWDFGDGFTSTLENPTHLYAQGGTYTVTLVAVNAYGSDQQIGLVEVLSPAQDAAFTWQPASPDPGETITFTAQATGTAPISYTWDFGDGGNGTGQVLTHTYAVTDSYVIILTATNVCADEAVSETIAVAFCTGPSGITMTYLPRPAMAHHATTFTATAAQGDEPISYTWHFDDGSGFILGNPVQHTYSEPGTYTVRLYATNACGTDQVTTIVVVEQELFQVYLPLVARGYRVPGDSYEYDNTPGQAKLLPLDSPQSRTFHEDEDEDWAFLELQADVTYYIWTHNLSQDPTAADTYMELFAPGQYSSALRENDDCGGPPPDNLASCFSFTPTSSGRYEVRVRNMSGNWGDDVAYTLEATQQ